MRFSVVHTTRYRYGAPVHLEPHTIRLCPRQDGGQRVLRHTLEITPTPAGRADGLDQDGNVITQAWFTGEIHTLQIHSQFEVETLRRNPFDFLIAQSDRDLRRDNSSGPVQDFARSLAAEAGNQTMPFLTALAQTLFSTVRQVVRREGPPNPPEVTLAAREGSCRDLAVLFCAACRAVGVTARFVSGYEREASLQENGEMHAWAEVYLEGGGWRGFDPSRGLAVADSHVAVAAAADPLLATPVTGAYRGPARSSLEFEISMQVS
jgi:transglutaminase-like putative cysteine protease